MSALRRKWSVLWRRQPLLSFAIGGGLLFLLLSSHLPWGRDTIVVDARTAAGILERRANLEGRELTASEREGALEDYVKDEILVREAYRNGWHLENARVRRRLVLAMRTMMSEDVPEPSLAQLRAFYQANAERYRAPASVTFAHVFFTEGSSRDVSHALARLETGADFRELGDDFALGSTMVRQTQPHLEDAWGRVFAETVFALEPGTWSGPINSRRGAHLVRVLERHPPELPDLPALMRFVRVDWESERRAEIHDRKMSRIRERYSVIEP